MSKMETIKGTLTVVKLPNCNSLEETCKAVCALNKFNTLYYITWQAILEEELSDKFMVLNGILYSIERTILNDDGFSEVSQNENGEIEFFVSFYNGGTYISEVIETAMRREGIL